MTEMWDYIQLKLVLIGIRPGVNLCEIRAVYITILLRKHYKMFILNVESRTEHFIYNDVNVSKYF